MSGNIDSTTGGIIIGGNNATFVNVGNTNSTITVYGNPITIGTGSTSVVVPGSMAVSGQLGAAGFYSTSDYTLKENITYINSVYDIEKLKPCTFNFKNSSETKLGFLAHEVQEVIPNSVIGEKDKTIQSIDYNAVLAACVKTIQELIERVKVLEKVLENK